jgi:hypothetical protein
MHDLAPRLCPVCDRPFEDSSYDEDEQRLIVMHVKYKQKCVREPGKDDRTETVKIPTF